MATTAINTTATIFGGIAVILWKTNHATSSIIFGIISVSLYLMALFVYRKESKQAGSTKVKLKPKQLKLTEDHKVILDQFRKYDGELLSSDDLQEFTHIEPIKVNASLADLESHGILHATNLDDLRGWLFTLSHEGRKLIIRNT